MSGFPGVQRKRSYNTYDDEPGSAGEQTLERVDQPDRDPFGEGCGDRVQ
mgnify:CR=1 FL=1